MTTLTALTARCQSCHARLRVKTHATEKAVSCPRCNTEVIFSAPSRTTEDRPTLAQARYKFPCPNCATDQSVPPGLIERRIVCRGCEQAILVPRPQSANPSQRGSVEARAAAGRAKRVLNCVATLVGCVIAWHVLFAVVSFFILQRPVQSPEGGQGPMVFGLLFGVVVWGCLCAAVMVEQYWAIGVSFVLVSLGLVFSVVVIFSGPLAITPEWPTYVGLVNQVGLFAVTVWGLVAKDRYAKLVRRKG